MDGLLAGLVLVLVDWYIVMFTCVLVFLSSKLFLCNYLVLNLFLFNSVFSSPFLGGAGRWSIVAWFLDLSLVYCAPV